MEKKIFIKIADVSDFSIENEAFPDAILTHVNKFHDSKKNFVSLAAYKQIGLLLREYLNVPIEMIYFLDTGKPCIKEGYISISHTGNICLVGCSKYEFGLDIEEIKDINYKVAKKLYKDRDINNITKEEYYLRWTFLEAKAKMNDSSIFDLDEENTCSISKIVQLNGKSYALSVVYKEKDIVLKE